MGKLRGPWDSPIPYPPSGKRLLVWVRRGSGSAGPGPRADMVRAMASWLLVLTTAAHALILILLHYTSDLSSEFLVVEYSTVDRSLSISLSAAMWHVSLLEHNFLKNIY